MLIATMIRQLVATGEPHAALVLTADLWTIKLGRIRQMSLFVAWEVGPAFEAKAATFELAHVFASASEVSAAVFFKTCVVPVFVCASLDGTWAPTVRDLIGGKKRWGDVTFPCTRLVDGSSSGRKLILIEVRRHVSLESQIVVESQFAARVQAVILGLDDGCKRALRLLGCV